MLGTCNFPIETRPINFDDFTRWVLYNSAVIFGPGLSLFVLSPGVFSIVLLSYWDQSHHFFVLSPGVFSIVLLSYWDQTFHFFL